jgi:hypothetical protein
MIRTVHPFPARMAPELAIDGMRGLSSNSVVLDPMMGSGTVVRHAAELGHRAIGFDIDPLAVLMTRVWTTSVDQQQLERTIQQVKKIVARRRGGISLPWIDADLETARYVDYWFDLRQQASLRLLAYALHKVRLVPTTRDSVDVLRLALSRIIITKERGASLARDVSHSRPHKTSVTSDFDVMAAFDTSVRTVARLLLSMPPKQPVSVALGDARDLKNVSGASVDAVVTSPPYLNAIDYMRGHRMALVWLGHKLGDLRRIRSGAIGAERAPDRLSGGDIRLVRRALGAPELTPRIESMVLRYCHDISQMMSEISRVLKRGGRAILVVGNSSLRGAFVHNSEGVVRAAELAGLVLKANVERELPAQHRYLPLSGSALAKRMRTEAVLSFTLP